MRFKATIVLSLLLILLGGYLFYIELPGARKKEEAEIKAKRFFSFTTASIAGITIKQPTGVIELEHQPDNPDMPWQIVHPVMTAANDATASAFAAQLEILQSTRLVEEQPTDLKQFGLDPPAYSLVVAIKRGPEQLDTEPLEVGGESLTKSDLYVRKGEGSPVYLVSSAIEQYLKKDLKNWRRRELFQFGAADVSKIVLEGGERHLELVRTGEEWRIEKPFSEKGDRAAISNLIGAILNLRGEDFIDDKKEETKKIFGPPLLTLHLTIGAVEREAAFYQVKNDPQAVYAITTPNAPIYRLSDQSFKLLEQPAVTYKEKKQPEKKEGPSVSSPSPAPSPPSPDK